MSFTVAIVGRPNVGKSTLFNRLVGRRLALVDDQPGVTRDRREGEARLGDLAFKVIDTAGLEDAERESLSARMQAQTAAAIAQADAVLFLVDARGGVTPADRAFADLVRKSGKPAILVANKSEGRAGAAGALEAYALGLGEPVAISAEHGEGLADLYDALRAALPEATAAARRRAGRSPCRTQQPIRIAIVGRPNTGKSTLINRLLGEDRLLTGTGSRHHARCHRRRSRLAGPAPCASTTPPACAAVRGSRRKLEKLSVADTLNAIRFAEVVVVLIDAQTPFEEQDIRIADLVEREGRAIVIAVNKWDLDRAGSRARCRGCAPRSIACCRRSRACRSSFCRRKAGSGLDRLMEAVLEGARGLESPRADGGAQPLPRATRSRPIRRRRSAAAASGSITSRSRKRGRRPSCCSPRAPSELPETYRRYLINGLRENFALPGTPIRLTLRAKANPYAGKKKRAALDRISDGLGRLAGNCKNLPARKS